MICRRPALPALVVGVVVAGLVTAAPALAAAPTVTSFTPTSGPSNTTVTIVGTGFTSPATVTVNGVASTTVTVSSSTKIYAKVPSSASTGRIAVTTSGGTGTSSGTFTVTPGMSLSTTSGPPTSVVTLRISGFSPGEATDFYVDSTEVLLAVTDSTGGYGGKLTIPASATPGTHWITAVGRRTGDAAQAAFAVHTDWAQFGDGPGHRSDNGYENALSPSTVSGLDETWRTAPNQYTAAEPVVAGGIVYAATGSGTIYAYDENTGAVKWSYTTRSAIEGAPVVANGVLYIGCYDGTVLALSASTGTKKWSVTVAGAIYASGAVAGNTYVLPTDSGTVYALNTTNGAQLWSSATDGGYLRTTPAISGGRVFVGTLSGGEYALDLATGATDWYLTTNSQIYSSAAVANGLVYFGTYNGYVYALYATTGQAAWIFNTSSVVEGSPAVANNVLYIGALDNTAYAFDATTGAQEWTAPSPATSLSGAVSVADGVAYFDGSGATFAYYANYGGSLWETAAGNGSGGTVVADGGVTISDSQTGTIIHYALDAGQTAIARPAPSALRPSL